MLAALAFRTPWGGLLGLAAVVPLAAAVLATRRNAAARGALGLAPPAARSRAVPALLVLVPLLLALAATEPVLAGRQTRRVRTDAQAMFVFDISRSMLASSGRRAPTRLARARAIAIRLRNDALPDVPAGISTITTILLPHVVPSNDLPVFDTSVRDSIRAEAPPPPALGLGIPGTSYSALTPLRDQGYFDPSIRHRVLILLTDGESGPYDAGTVAQALRGPDQPNGLSAGATIGNQAPIGVVVVRIGGAGDRIYDPDGTVEPTYRPDPRAAQLVDSLAHATRGWSFDTSEVGAAGARIRALLGAGRTKDEGVRPTSVDLAPWFVAAALAGLAAILWRRNARSL